MKKYWMIISALFFISLSVNGQEMDNRNENKDKDDFIVIAASGGMMEVELGRLAEENGYSEEVKEFGSRMVRDHSKANDELKNIAQKNNIQLPESMLEKHQSHVDELSELSGIEFDEAYMDLMAEDHEEDVELFEEASEEYENEEVKEWAEKNLSVLKEHHELAENIKDKMDQ